MARINVLCVLIVLAAACSKPDAQSEHVKEVIAAGGVVDSAIEPEKRLWRFRATVAERPDSLRHASPSLERLVDRWAAAIARSDTVALNAMILDRAEFAWLFYADTRLAKPPYEMPPAVLWEQMLGNSNEGARTALATFGGRSLTVRSIRCPAPADTEGSNIVQQSCVVRLTSGRDTVPEGRWFGSVIERDGRFKFLGLSTSK